MTSLPQFFGQVDYNLNLLTNPDHKLTLDDISSPAGSPASRSVFLVPKLGLGTHLPAKLSLATIFVPKYNLGTSGKS